LVTLRAGQLSLGDYVIGRAAYALLYHTGIPFIRVPAFSLASLSSIYLLAMVVHGAI